MSLHNKAGSTPKGGDPSVIRGRASSLQLASMKEQRRLEENLQALSKEMRSRMNQLDSETNEMRRQAARMFDAVRRKEHQRAVQSRLDGTSLRTASSDNLNDAAPRSLARVKSAGRLKMAPASMSLKNTDTTLSQIQLERSYSSPASIAKLSQIGSSDVELPSELSSRSDISDESIAADAASIPVTNLPNFCVGRELEMIGESTLGEDDNEDEVRHEVDGDGNVKRYHIAYPVIRNSNIRHCVSEGAPSPLFNSQADAHSETGNLFSDEHSKLLMRRRRTSDIVKPVTLAASPRAKPSRRHSSHEPAAFFTYSGTRSTHDLLLHRTSSVNLPPLRQSFSGMRPPVNQMMSPPLSPSASSRNLAGARPKALLRRASHTESSPCIMKQTFASTPRRSMSQVVGELVHIEEMRRQSKDASMQDDCRRARRTLLGNRSFPNNHPERGIESGSLSKTQSLGDIFNELKDCRYLRITNQDQST